MSNIYASKYRWIIVFIIFMGITGMKFMWFVPSPLLTVIMRDLNISLTLGGLGISIICLLIAIFSLTGGWLAERISIHHTIFLFSISSLIAAISTFLMKETGAYKNAHSQGGINR